MNVRFPFGRAPIPLKCRYLRLQRLYSSITHPAESTEPSSTPTNNGETRTFKARRGTNRALPLPPLIDPVRMLQRHKRRNRFSKAPPTKYADLTPFQLALQNNPYARALAEPLRDCKIGPTTQSARLPKFFLIEMDVKKHPEPPHNPCLLPSRLFSAASPDHPTQQSKQGTATYFLARQALIRWMKTKLVANREGWKFAMGYRANDISKAKGDKEIIWREDMDEFVLKLVRGAVTRSLRWLLLHHSPKMLQNCEGGAFQAKELDDVGCVVYICSTTSQALRDAEAAADAVVARGEEHVTSIQKLQHNTKKKMGTAGMLTLDFPSQTYQSTDIPKMNPKIAHPPLRYPTVAYREQLVPVYSLEDLLGVEKCKDLLEGTAFSASRCFVLKTDRLTTRAQMWLMKLQGFLT